ncbi:hypothetical protein BDN70DRAFT_974564 [Pholiota conissans]|uniref:Hemerythrin-like domain-containing protein n=1 Tax=Pholiota conissans TaxID=109636 RepID=A0A9P6D7D1_9AGAR|nr:hypothetical protein BDN70DRAFT_974564 [Pholiota conissans]
MLTAAPIQIAADHEGPYPCIPITCNFDLDFGDHNNIALWFADDLALTHNVIIRGLNSIWLKAPLVSPEDEADFVGYCLVCVDLIRAHHKAQETIIFPLLQERIDMRTNVVEHLSFEAALHDFEVYLKQLQAKKAIFDNFKILELRKAFGSVLVQHFHAEIPLLFDKFGGLEDHYTKIRESQTLFPFIMTHHNREDASTWSLQITQFTSGYPVNFLITYIATTGNSHLTMPLGVSKHILRESTVIINAFASIS